MAVRLLRRLVFADKKKQGPRTGLPPIERLPSLRGGFGFEAPPRGRSIDGGARKDPERRLTYGYAAVPKTHAKYRNDVTVSRNRITSKKDGVPKATQEGKNANLLPERSQGLKRRVAISPR